MADCCTDYTRSALMRQAVAEAGRGLPAIEPGMPIPAGTGLSRRNLLLRSVGLAVSVYGASRLSPQAFDEGIAMAAAPNDPVLVSVFLDGGMDSLSLLAPTGDGLYQTRRPTLALPQGTGTSFSEDSRLEWAPQASGLSTLHREGKLTVLPAVGYTSPNQSHFTSRHYWEVGATDAALRLGWMGRYLDRVGSDDNPLQGLTLSSALAPVLATAAKPVAAVTRADAYTLDAPEVFDQPGVAFEGQMRETFGSLGRLPAATPALSLARRITRQSSDLHDQLAGFTEGGGATAYPSGTFPTRLEGLASMLGAGLPLRCVALEAAGGYDTHSNQAGAFAANVRLTCDSLLAFQRDLEQRGLANRVLTLVWSEFGRRPEENGSLGTDHGAAGAAFLMGTRARGTMVGEFPGLATLDPQQNLRATSDFRSLYCGLLEDWLGSSADGIIPGQGGLQRYNLIEP